MLLLLDVSRIHESPFGRAGAYLRASRVAVHFGLIGVHHWRQTVCVFKTEPRKLLEKCKI